MLQANPSIRHPYPRLRRFAADLAITQVFNVMIAVLITWVVRAGDSFFVNLVVSICVGTLTVTFIDSVRLALWSESRPPWLPFIALLIASYLAAQYLGYRIASLLLDIPMAAFEAARLRHGTGMMIGGIATFMFIISFFWSRERIAFLKAESEAEKARAAAIEKQAMQAQLQMLQAQIEPHMLFNTLANLQGLIAIDPQRAQHMLDQLIQYLRATLSASRAEKTTLAQEFSLLEAYLGLMKVRMGSRLSYAFHLSEELRDTMVPPMLLQPLVENAIKHGLEPKVDGGHIDVKAVRDGGRLMLTVIDTGLGLGADMAANSSGTRVGVSNIRERLQVLYGEQADFSLTNNTPSGVIANITLPL